MVLAILSYMVSRNECIDKNRKGRAPVGRAGDRGGLCWPSWGRCCMKARRLMPGALYVACNAVGFALTPLIPLLLAPVFGASAAARPVAGPDSVPC